MCLVYRNAAPFLSEAVLMMHLWDINIRDRLRVKTGLYVCVTNSSKRENRRCLRIKKILGTWGIVCFRYGNSHVFGYLTSLTFYLTSIMYKYKSSWIYHKTNKLIIL